MKTIYKYPLIQNSVRITIEMPDNAKILLVEKQGTTTCLWALIDSDASIRTYKFRIFGTGGVVPEDIVDHVWSWQDGPYVWHLFHER